jgi:uncharacterized protein YbaR (Trm112 family)
MLDPDILKIMCCPETHQELRFAPRELIARLNRQVEQKTLKNRGGQVVTERLEEGLIRADGKFVYPMRANIPVMLVEEAIGLVD